MADARKTMKLGKEVVCEQYWHLEAELPPQVSIQTASTLAAAAGIVDEQQAAFVGLGGRDGVGQLNDVPQVNRRQTFLVLVDVHT